MVKETVKEEVKDVSVRVANWLITIALYAGGVVLSVWVSRRFLLGRYPERFLSFFDIVPGSRIVLYLLPLLAVMAIVVVIHDVFAKERG